MVPDNREQVSELLWHVDAQLEDRGWDQPPALLGVYRRVRDDDAAVMLGAVEIPLFRTALESVERPPTALSVLAHALRTAPDEQADLILTARQRRQVSGLVLATEAWMLRKEGDVDADEVMRYASEHRISEHRDRIEIRLLMLVSGTHMLTLMHERDGIPQMMSGSTMTGAVHDALSELWEAVKSRD